MIGGESEASQWCCMEHLVFGVNVSKQYHLNRVKICGQALKHQSPKTMHKWLGNGHFSSLTTIHYIIYNFV